jgi:hypothetical protein
MRSAIPGANLLNKDHPEIGDHAYFTLDAAAFSTSLVTTAGVDTITTWEAPFTTTVSFVPARCAMKA